jgi:hypothetical protein
LTGLMYVSYETPRIFGPGLPAAAGSMHSLASARALPG